MLFDPLLSSKGALLPLNRKEPLHRHEEYTESMGPIVLPNALQLFQTEEARSLKSIRAKVRKDPLSRTCHSPALHLGARQGRPHWQHGHANAHARHCARPVARGRPRQALLNTQK